jgi:hypothetical protein
MAIAINWKAAAWAGLIAGAVFLILEMVLFETVGGASFWGPPRMMAAIVMGEGVLPPPATFDAGIVTVAMLVHFPLAIVYGLILGWAISNWNLGLGGSIAVGIIFGLLLYVINFYGFTAIWPWFEMARNWISIFAHAVFGLVLGWAYHRFARSTRATN